MAAGGSGGRRGAHFAPASAPSPVQARPRRRRPWRALLAALLLAVLAGGALLGWRRFGDALLARVGRGPRTVAVTVDGHERRIAEGSSVADVFDQVRPAVAAGDLLSVTGGVLGTGAGDAFAARLDGQDVPYAEAASTPVAEGSQLAFSDGADATEDFTTETVATSTPRLVRRVADGTYEKVDEQTGVVQYVYQWGRQGTREVRTGVLSGETADGEELPGQDLVVMCQDIHPDGDEKLVALTFDDGPGVYTERFLQVLDSYGVKATFNLIGEQVADGADAVRQEVAAGHQVCSHTWTHPYLPTLGVQDLLAQLDDTFGAIRGVGGVDTTTIRAPYGAISVDVWLASQGHMSASVCWSHDSEDWKLPGVDVIVANCTADMHPGSVILMHDAGGERAQGLQALPQIIEAWQAAGYRFVTMEELMASDGSIPAECAAGYRPMPEDAVWPTEIA